jgi:hypothetical protein
VLATNVKGVWLLVKHEVAAQMRRQGHGGSIVNTSSVAATGGSSYRATGRYCRRSHLAEQSGGSVCHRPEHSGGWRLQHRRHEVISVNTCTNGISSKKVLMLLVASKGVRCSPPPRRDRSITKQDRNITRKLPENHDRLGI